MASSARHLFLLAFVAALAVATPSGADAWGGRLFFSKTTRPEAAVEAEKVAAATPTTTAVPDAADPNGATAPFSRPSTGGSSGRGYGLYGRPGENFPPAYFRRGVHHNAEKLTTTSTVEERVPVGGGRGERPEPFVEDNGSGRGRPPWTNVNVPTTSTEEKVPAGGGGGSERAEPFVEDNGSGRGRPPWTTSNVQTTTTTTEETVPVGSGGERPEPFVEDNGSGRGRPPWYYGPDADGRAPEEQRDYGMSDTRLYQNGRYYYDVGNGRYGYGRESNPVRTRQDEFEGSGFGRAGAGDRRGRYGNGNAAGYRYVNGNAAGYQLYGNGNAAGYQYDNGNEFRNGVMENQSGFQEEGRHGRYIP